MAVPRSDWQTISDIIALGGVMRHWWCHACGRSPTTRSAEWWTTAEKRTAKQRKKKRTGRTQWKQLHFSSVSLGREKHVHTNTLICLSEHKDPHLRNDSFWPRVLIRPFACSPSPAGCYLPRYLWQGNRSAAQGQNCNQPRTFCSAKKPLSPPVNCNNPRNPETIRLQSPPDVSPHSETWWKLMKPQGNHGKIICRRQWAQSERDPDGREVTWPIKPLPFIPTDRFVCISWIFSERQNRTRSFYTHSVSH